MTEKKPDARRGEMAFMVAIVLGVLLGVFIKRIRVGLMIGIALGLLIVFTGLLRSTRRR
jgi:hypothetical protein